MQNRELGLRISFPRRSKEAVGLTLALIAALCFRPPVGLLTPARANGIETIAKDTIYGAGTGLFLGAVTSLVVKEGKRDETIKWGLVLGTFAGFGYGLYELSGNGFSAVPAPTQESHAFVDAAHPALGIGQPPMGARPEPNFAQVSPPALGLEPAAVAAGGMTTP